MAILAEGNSAHRRSELGGHMEMVSNDPQASVREEQDGFAWQVISLISVAQDIRAGRAEDLAARIEDMLPTYLEVMADFDDSALRTVAFYAAGLLYAESRKQPPEWMSHVIGTAKTDISQVLSEDCFEEMRCKPGKGCVPWPTSLRAVDVSRPSPMGWRYIVDSHCGFSWPKFWKPACGAPIGLVACTG
jgi:hypothetical protein